MVNSGNVQQTNSDHGEAPPPSRHLWVGNLSPSVPQVELRQIFSRFGVIDKIFWYALKRYAFVNFMHQEDAENAKNKLQGALVGGFALRIEFAKGDQKLETRNLGGREEDRLHLSTSDPNNVSQNHSRGARHLSADSNTLHATQVESRTITSGGSKGARDGEPTNVLWIGFPPNVKVEEQDLHRAFIPFAEIERITIFSDRFYAFLELRSVEEAVIAKNALAGKLFNDSRFRINFSSSQIGPVNRGNSGSVLFLSPIGDVGGSEACFTRHRLGSPSNPFTMADELNSRPSMRPPNSRIKLSGGYESTIGMGIVQGGYISEICKRSGANPIPAADKGSLPALSLHGRPSEWTGPPNIWDLPEEDIIPRDFKRARIAATPPPVDRFMHSSLSVNTNPRHIIYNNGATHTISEKAADMGNNMILLPSCGDVHVQNFEETRTRPHLGGLSFSRPIGGANFEGNFQPLSNIPLEKVGCLNEPMLGVTNGDWKWEGNIAKGGTFICRTRCFPIGVGIDVDLPEVINCTARTDLDMLGKHILQTGECGVIYFVPQGDAHVAPYRDFLHYLWKKNRAGVSKLGDGISLFLVPSSSFSEKILKVSRRDCLFGVVLKSPEVNNVGLERRHEQSIQHQPQKFPVLQNDVQIVHRPISQPPEVHLYQLPVQQLSAHLGQSKELVSPSQEYKEYKRFPSSEGNPSLQSGVLASIINQLTIAQSANGTFSPELIASLTALLPHNQGCSGLNQPVSVGSDTGPAAGTFPGSVSTGGASVQTTETARLRPVYVVDNGVSMQVTNQSLGKVNPPLPPGLPPFLQEQNTSPYTCQAPQPIVSLPSFTFNPVPCSEPLAQQDCEQVQRVHSSGEPHASYMAVIDQGLNIASTTPEATSQQNQTSSSYPQTLALPPTDQLVKLFQILVQSSQKLPELSPNANVQQENFPNWLLQPLIHQSQPLPQAPYVNQVQVMQQHGTVLQDGGSIQKQILIADQDKKVAIQEDVTKDEDVEKLRFQATLQLAQTLLQQMQQQDIGGTIRQQ